jgi:ribonuclease R
MLDDLYVEGLIHVTGLPKDYYYHEATQHRMVGERTGRVFRLGDKVKVRVVRVNLDERKIDFELAEQPKSSGSPAAKKTAKVKVSAKAKEMAREHETKRKSKGKKNKSSGRSGTAAKGKSSKRRRNAAPASAGKKRTAGKKKSSR